MKKYIFFIVGIGIILAGLLVYNVYNVQKENTKVFEDPGYILQSASSQSQKIDKYYFNADEEYKIKNNQKVIFIKIPAGMKLQQEKITSYTIIMEL